MTVLLLIACMTISAQSARMDSAMIAEYRQKTGNEITVAYKVTLDVKADDRKQTGLLFRFTDGVSDNEKVNELSSYMSRYVSAREQIDK